MALSGMAAIAATYVDENLLFASAVMFLIAGGWGMTVMVLNRYFYTAMLLGFHIVMIGFTGYVLINRDRVIDEPMFSFSVFSLSNLQVVLANLVLVSMIIYSIWSAFRRRTYRFSDVTPENMLYELFGEIKKTPRIAFRLSLGGSFLLGLLLFITNPSVIGYQYPSQVEFQWVQRELIKLPTFLSIFALVYCYAGVIRADMRDIGLSYFWLQIAQVNFLFISVLMLLLTGSRGMFTFLWAFVGLFELLLWKKGRRSPRWGLFFLLLSWFSFQSFPYMRSELSQSALLTVLHDSLLLAVGLGGGSSDIIAGGADIRINDVTMIGQSLFHFLYVVELIDSGNSLAGQTFLNLVPQMIPDFLDKIFFERPINDNWILTDYYFHGGGFLVIANAYWNGGTWVACLFIALLTGIFVGFDRYLHNQNSGGLYKGVYWLWLPVMVVQLGYGIQGLARVVELLAVVIAAECIFRRKRKARHHEDVIHLSR